MDPALALQPDCLVPPHSLREVSELAVVETQGERLAELEHVLVAATGAFPATAASLRRLRNGVEIFPAMLDAIEAAREHIAFVTFVYWTGEIAERFAAALAAAARRGVKVRVVLDSVGARSMDDALVREIEAAGVELRWFRPLTTWRIWRSSHRTHRKLLIVDGDRGFTGGVGIAAEWEGDARDASEWRDTHFELRGQAVVGLWAAFVETWIEAGGEPLSLPLGRSHEAAVERCRVHVLAGTATVGWSLVARALWSLLSAAQSSITIATAYFNPDEQTIDLLVDKARAGVEIDILIPGENIDVRLAQVAGEPRMRPLLDAGVRLAAFEPSMMHTKLLIIDEALACIGSANINGRSLQKDEEIMLATGEANLVRTLLDDFAEDLERSRRITNKDLVDRPWWRRSLAAFLELFRGEL